MQVIGKIVIEADLAIGAMSQQLPVYPDVAVGHHATEDDEGAASGSRHRDVESLAIPADSRRKETTGRTGGILFVNGTGDGPVVRKRHRLPGRVIKGRRLSAQRIGLQKALAAGEGLDLAGGSARRNDAAANRNKRRRRRGHGDAWLKERFLMSINRSMSMEELERQKHGLLSFFRREVSMTAAGDDVLAVGYVRVIERLFQLG